MDVRSAFSLLRRQLRLLGQRARPACTATTVGVLPKWSHRSSDGCDMVTCASRCNFHASSPFSSRTVAPTCGCIDCDAAARIKSHYRCKADGYPWRNGLSGRSFRGFLSHSGRWGNVQLAAEALWGREWPRAGDTKCCYAFFGPSFHFAYINGTHNNKINISLCETSIKPSSPFGSGHLRTT